MRVLLAHNKYRAFGGEDRHVALLEPALREAGVETRLFEQSADALEHSLPRRLRAGVSLAYNPGGGGIGEPLDEWTPDVVHFHNLWPLLTPAALRIARRRGAAVVLTVHNCRFACPGGTCTVDTHPAQKGLFDNHCLSGSSLRCGVVNNPREKLSESIAYGTALELHRRLRLLERWVDAFIAPSEYIARMLELVRIPRERIHVIPNGISPETQDGSRGREFALFIGRISPEKGIRTLIEAADLAMEVPIATAGTGPLDAEVRSSRIRPLGPLDRDSLEQAVADAAFTILPSECHENSPYALLESFATAKPAIATRVGGIPEIVRHEETGLIVAPRDPRGLAESLIRLWRDPDLMESLGSRALRSVHQTFSLDRQIERTLDLYRQLGADSASPVRVGRHSGPLGAVSGSEAIAGQSTGIR